MVYAHHGQRLLKVPEVVARLGTSRSKLYELIARKEIDSVLLGGSRRFTERAVDEYIAKLEAEAKASA